MSELEIMLSLMKYQSGGNHFVLFKMISLNADVNGICHLTQNILANKLKKSRPTIKTGLQVLEKEGLIEFSYRKIKIICE